MIHLLKLENVNLDLPGEAEPVRILSEINLVFETGKMYALTGPNGGGKSSLARVIMGIYKPSQGKIIYDDEDISELGITERAQKGIGYAFQQPPRFKGMQVSDLLNLAKKSVEQRNCSVLYQIGLCPDEYRSRELNNSLSGGEMKRIEIATMLALNPRVRIFDEPEAGIDLWSFNQLIEVIGSSHTADTITVIISHQEKILNMVDQIALIREGRVSMLGDRDTIWPQIKESALCSCRQNCTLEENINADCPR
jgi:Fe-S cluster assembly ATP-binding protein